MQKNKGFTLIELIAVIVILGLLAATAAIRSQSLTTAAKTAAVKNLGASLISAATLHATHFYTSSCFGLHANGAGNLAGVSYHYRQVYSGDWEPRFDTRCAYQGDVALDGIPEIIEALGLTSEKINSYWMLHNRQDPAPHSDALWIAPFPPSEKRGVRIVSFASPASQGQVSELTSTNCYVKYSTPHSVFTSPKIETVTSGCDN